MADEWSKPVKGADGVWRTGTGGVLDWANMELQGGELFTDCESDRGWNAPRDVVLRLLAAEASDRLGWVWEVDTGEWIASSDKSIWGRHAETGEPITYDDHFGFTADELLASVMGRFLLADALREAGP